MKTIRSYEELVASEQYDILDLIPGNIYQLGHTYWLHYRNLLVTVTDNGRKICYGLTEDGKKLILASPLDYRVDKEVRKR